MAVTCRQVPGAQCKFMKIHSLVISNAPPRIEFVNVAWNSVFFV